jgi:hypothetical protein
VKEQEHEVLEHWWEYFTVIKWVFSPPGYDKLMGGIKAPNLKQRSDHYKKILDHLNSEITVDTFRIIIDTEIEREDQRKQVIETKAHSILSQTGIATSLLIGSISLGSANLLTLSTFWKIAISAFLVLIVGHFVIAALYARLSVILSRGYVRIDFEEEGEFSAIERAINRMFALEYNSYLNDIKGTYLKLSHWFLKLSFVSILFASIALPSIMFFTVRTQPEVSKSAIYQPGGITNSKVLKDTGKSLQDLPTHLDTSTLNTSQ